MSKPIATMQARLDCVLIYPWLDSNLRDSSIGRNERIGRYLWISTLTESPFWQKDEIAREIKEQKWNVYKELVTKGN